MLLSEAWARLALVAHTVLAAAAVASVTHALVWLRHAFTAQHAIWLAANDPAVPAASRVAKAVERSLRAHRLVRIALVLYLGSFALGNLMYPTYRVRVRDAFLDNPVAVRTERVNTLQAEQRIMPDSRTVGDPARRAAQIARWFDIKEHWLALGAMAGLALWLLSRGAAQRLCALPAGADHKRQLTRLLTEQWFMAGLAWFWAAAVWSGAVIGIAVAAWRAI